MTTERQMYRQMYRCVDVQMCRLISPDTSENEQQDYNSIPAICQQQLINNISTTHVLRTTGMHSPLSISPMQHPCSTHLRHLTLAQGQVLGSWYTPPLPTPLWSPTHTHTQQFNFKVVLIEATIIFSMRHKSVSGINNTTQDQHTPISFTLNLDLDTHRPRVERKGYLSSRLTSYKKQLQPVGPPSHIKQSREYKRLLEIKRSSLKLLPRLNHYEFPIEQVEEKEVPESSCKTHLKISPLRTLHDFKTRKSQLREDLVESDIDSILIRMIGQEEIVHRTKEETLERQLTQQGAHRTRIRSMNPRLEILAFKERMSLGPNVRQSESPSGKERRQESKSPVHPRNRHEDSQDGRDKPEPNKQKSRSQLRGWEEWEIEAFSGF